MRRSAERSIWGLVFGLLALYVAARMGAFSLSAAVKIPGGIVHRAATYASVDHPFHVARAETLWRELASGNVLRWVGQHQGGYPVEFYPLGEAWLEVAVRGLSLGRLTAEGAHTLTIIALFLLPGVAFAALAHLDGWSPVAGLIALVLHVSLPGGWYDGGYTELVQWGLVTNVAAAVASMLMLPALIQFLRTGIRWTAAVAALLAAFAVYANPRSLLGLGALGLAAWLVGILRPGGASFRVLTSRLALVSGIAALLGAPELIALARFGDLYTFVLYSGYGNPAEYALNAARAISWPVFVLGLLGLGVGLAVRQRRATTTVAAALLLYVALTVTLVVAPAAAGLAPQLEPTRLMPLQRMLTIYLAAVASWMMFSWIVAALAPSRQHVAPWAGAAVVTAILLIQTRPVVGPAPDPASPAIPSVGLYPITMSARPEQIDFEEAVRAADVAAPADTALLVLGSALSWHQQLWAPLWTTRPLFYDNWLWYWRPDHVGTPGYAFLAGHHYPDPEQTLDRDYLDRHAIGAVIVTGPLRDAAARSPLLRPFREGIYDGYTVADPVTTVTFGDQNASSIVHENQRVTATSTIPAESIIARINWHPRWAPEEAESPTSLERLNTGYLGVVPGAPTAQAQLNYSVQPLDWLARGLAAIGGIGICWLILRRHRERSQEEHWYSRLLRDEDAAERNRDREPVVKAAGVSNPGRNHE